MITDEMVEAAARGMCKSNGTAQCAAICLSRFASDNQNGKCADAKYVYGRSARAALEAVAPMIRDAALEEAARTLETMSFLLSIGSPEEGPFTRQDRVRDEVIEQGATAIRALKERADKLDKLDKLDKIGETDR